MAGRMALAAAALGLALAGCNTVYGLVGDERTGARTLQDANASRAIKSRMSRADGFYLGDVDVEVTEGVALLTGEVPRPEDKIEAERIAWTSESIAQVGNEITVGAREEFSGRANDELIAQQVRARLASDSGVRSVNFNVEAHQGVVYLLGVARDQAELERAARIASLAPDVRRVVTYVRIEGEPVSE